MKNIYISWHYTTHGIAYLKHILSKFYTLGEIPEKIDLEENEQEELNSVFGHTTEKGFLFDEIIYLTAPQTAFDKLSSRRFSYKKTILEDDLIKESELIDIYKEIIADEDKCYILEKELDHVKEKHPDRLDAFKKLIWRNIHHYPIEEQIRWLTEYSNFQEVYKDRLKIVELNIDDLRNEKRISEEVSKWSREYFAKNNDIQNIINVSLGSNETQVVWHILAEAGQLPENTRFIKTYDDKLDQPKEKRFKQFSIQEIPTNLISSIGTGFTIYSETKSPPRQLVNKKMEVFLKSGFSILLIGERGIGKSQIAHEAKKLQDKNESKNSKDVDEKKKNQRLVEANCASFDNDNKAEAELFGYEKGAFTGANALKKGLLEEANKGILFLDEIHHLSKLVQAKLMKALQTDKNNKMSIRRMGNTNEIEVECRLIFATNKEVDELRNILMPDFYDRIVQHVVHIPPLRDTKEDRVADWENIWEGLKLKKKAPTKPKLIEWIKDLPLYGNYRDLQKIAMYYNAFSEFDDETKEMLNERSAFRYAKSEFEKYHSPVVQTENEKFNFNIHQKTKEMIADYLFELQNWAVIKFKGRKPAIEHFNSLSDTITEKTLNNWKNRKSVKPEKTETLEK